MAQGDLTIFDEAKLALLDGTHDLDTHTFKVMFISNATVPAAADVTPVKADYTEVSGGNFTAGGDTMTVSLTEAAGTVTFDFTTNISNAKNASNPTNVYYAVGIDGRVIFKLGPAGYVPKDSGGATVVIYDAVNTNGLVFSDPLSEVQLEIKVI